MPSFAKLIQPFLMKIIGSLVGISLALLAWIGKSIDARLESIAMEIKSTNTVVLNMQNQFKEHLADYKARLMLIEHRMDALDKKEK